LSIETAANVGDSCEPRVDLVSCKDIRFRMNCADMLPLAAARSKLKRAAG